MAPSNDIVNPEKTRLTRVSPICHRSDDGRQFHLLNTRKEEYRGKIKYLDEKLKEHLVMEVMLN